MHTNWFNHLFGFEERSPQQVRSHLEVDGSVLRSRENGASYQIGVLETPSLGELRTRAGRLPVGQAPQGPIQVRNVAGEAGALHAGPGNTGALFQVASQFNLLEMVSPDVSPEDGVTRYICDRTQGPACAIAAGAATVYRNYFAELTRRQLKRLAVHSVGQLVHAITTYIDDRNRAPKPFVWTATVQYIFAKVNRAKATLAALH